VQTPRQILIGLLLVIAISDPDERASEGLYAHLHVLSRRTGFVILAVTPIAGRGRGGDRWRPRPGRSGFAMGILDRSTFRSIPWLGARAGLTGKVFVSEAAGFGSRYRVATG
jgi:hypothetical protein